MENQSFESLYRSWFDLSKTVFPSFFSSGPGGGQPQGGQKNEFEKISKSMFGLPPASLMEIGVGPSVEAYKDYLDLVSSQIELYRHTTDIWVKFFGVWVEGTQAAMSKVSSEIAKSSADPRKRAYNVWIEELERRFEILLRDEGFTTELGRFVSSYLQVKRRSDRMMERYFSRLNVPTKSEINGIYKRLHELEKKVDKLTRERQESGV